MQEELKKDLADEHNLDTAISSIEAENKVYAEAKAKEQEFLDNGLEYCNKAISDFLVNVENEYGSVYVTLD